MPSQAEKADVFRALHARDGAFVIPNPWDIGSAQIFAGMGFQALATTSSGFGGTLGLGDYEVPRDDVLAHCKALAQAVDLPVSADLEGCFADTPDGVAETVKLAAETGLVGCSIEDFSGNVDDPILPMDVAVERTKAAVEAARGAGFAFTLTARAENLLNGRNDLEDTIKRLQAFEEVGADVLYAPGLRTLDEVRAIAEAVTKPINVLNVFVRDASVAQLAEAGATRISLGGALYRAAMGEAIRSAQELLDDGTHTFAMRAARGELGEFMSAGSAGDK